MEAGTCSHSSYSFRVVRYTSARYVYNSCHEKVNWAAELLVEGSADAAFIGWALVLDTSWGNNAAAALGAAPRFLEHYEYAV